MKMTRCLAILVVAMCLVSGCVLVAGPQGCENGVQGFSCAPADASDGTTGYDGGGSETNNPDSVGNDTVGQTETAQDACAPYKAQVEFLEKSGTWKKCVYHKTMALYNLTFKSEVDKAGRCIAIAIEDETASVLCSTVVPSTIPGESKFTGTAFDGQTTVECSK